MKNGTVILGKTRKREDYGNWLNRFVAKAIEYFTGQPYAHVLIILNNTVYESTVGGAQKKEYKEDEYKGKYSVYLDPKRDLTEKEIDQMVSYADTTIKENWPYNYLKLFTLAIVYPTRKFWNKLGWVPFQRDWFGTVCSVYVDQIYKSAGIDLLPEKNEEYTSPGDFLNSSFFGDPYFVKKNAKLPQKNDMAKVAKILKKVFIGLGFLVFVILSLVVF